MPEAVLLISHGSRDAAANEEFARFAELVRERFAPRLAQPCFLQLAEPNVAQGIAALAEQGATRIVALPVILFTGGHVKRDIPQALATAGARHAGLIIRLGPPLGAHEALLDALSERLTKVGFASSATDGETALLLVGPGSREAEARNDFQQLAHSFTARHPYAWTETCYVSLAEPDVADGAQRCIEHGARRIVVLPCLLFAAEFMRRLAVDIARLRSQHEGVEFVVADHLGFAPQLAKALESRLAEAEDGPHPRNRSE